MGSYERTIARCHCLGLKNNNIDFAFFAVNSRSLLRIFLAGVSSSRCERTKEFVSSRSQAASIDGQLVSLTELVINVDE